jgi:RNA chaperone Hfq
MISQEDLLNNSSLIQNVLTKAKSDQMVNRLYLINAVRLDASLIDFDDNNLLISGHNDSLTLVYFHAISSFTQTESNANEHSFDRTGNSLEFDFFTLCESYEYTNVFLINGIKLKGKVVAFDNQSLLMTSTYNNKETSQIIMKTAIASVVPE